LLDDTVDLLSILAQIHPPPDRPQFRVPDLLQLGDPPAFGLLEFDEEGTHTGQLDDPIRVTPNTGDDELIGLSAQ
jgi:hypothetical protein